MYFHSYLARLEGFQRAFGRSSMTIVSQLLAYMLFSSYYSQAELILSNKVTVHRQKTENRDHF